MSAPAHVPVMVEEVLGLLAPKSGARIVDATTGLGGHAARIAERIGPDGELIGLDRDPEMLARAAETLAPWEGRIDLVQARMSFMGQVLRGRGTEHVDGVLMDLGVCSLHLDDPGRGFSFRDRDGSVPLDMRMNRSEGEPAWALIERLDEAELADVLREGGAPAPRAVARALERSAPPPLRTARDLLDAIADIKLPRRKHHPGTLVFQALRIAVNREYEELDLGLEAAVEALVPGGRLAVLTYHSGEDRRTKSFLAREARGCICPPDLPMCGCGRVPRMRVLARGSGASGEEVAANPRARSARLRGGERC